MSANDKIRLVLEKYGEEFTEGQGGNVWRVQGTPVIAHKTLERIAAQAGITFDLPTILRSERDEAVILVAGKLNDRREWSIGEALVNVNYRVSGKQAAYVYAMAEKRAKDRVILKLVELHGVAFSEEEADEFKGQAGAAQSEQDEAAEAARRFIADCERAIDAEDDRDTLIGWWNGQGRKDSFRANRLTADEGKALAERVRQRAEALAAGNARAAA
ncbi:trna delta -isopentenylpyrophosphate transferase [Methylobacterium brachiatum]